MRYPGGKGKTFQHVINLMPPHQVYIETHLGGGAVMRHKKPALINIGIDANPKVISAWREREQGEDVQLLCERAEDFLRARSFTGDELVYTDPPYHPATRRRERVYAADCTERDHERLLDILTTLPCKVILSGYANAMYAAKLAGWNTVTFRAKTHVDVREETLWFNFPAPQALHDDRYVGSSFRERQTVHRRMQRWKDKVHGMAPVERASFIRWLNDAYPGQGALP